MPVTVGHTAYNSQNSGTPNTWSHDCTGDNLLIVSMVFAGSPAVSNVAATYNSVSMTQIVNIGGYPLYVFKLKNPSTGSNTVSVTWTASGSLNNNGGSVSFINATRGVGTISVVDPHIMNPDISVSATITSNDMLLGILTTGATNDLVHADHTLLFKTDAGAAPTNAEETNTGSGSVTVSFYNDFSGYVGSLAALPILFAKPGPFPTFLP